MSFSFRESDYSSRKKNGIQQETEDFRLTGYFFPVNAFEQDTGWLLKASAFGKEKGAEERC